LRLIDSNTSNALNGSRTGDTITVYAWYGGQLAYPDPLPVSAWSMDWDKTRTVQTMTLDVTDKDGTLAPWLLEDPLGVGGTRLQVTYQVGGAGVVNMGWYRITQSTPAETWHSYLIDNLGQVNPDSPIPPGKNLATVTGGATIHLTADDLGVIIGNARLLAPDSPQGTSPTIISEITRLLDGIVPVVTVSGVTDRPVNKNLIYKDDRLAAVADLCSRITCDYRMNGNGQFEVYPVTAQTPVWTVKGGPEGALVQVSRDQKIDALYNVFVARGTATVTKLDGTTQQVPIQAIAQITTGPLRVGGPHGTYPTFYDSTMLTTRAECDAYAATMRDTQLQGLTTDLVVTCLPNPAIQQGDWVTVASPVVNQQTVTLNGKAKTMHLQNNGNTVAAMTLTVECTYADVQAALGAVTRG
jgi:tellurite resistance-related uncharacterized protein